MLIVNSYQLLSGFFWSEGTYIQSMHLWSHGYHSQPWVGVLYIRHAGFLSPNGANMIWGYMGIVDLLCRGIRRADIIFDRLVRSVHPPHFLLQFAC